MSYPQFPHRDPLSRLIFEFGKLPGIGEKTATRLAYFILRQSLAQVKTFSQAIIEAKEKIVLCSQCFLFTEVQPCKICSHPARDQKMICVVEKISDALSIEQAGIFKGTYHILHGTLSPLEGIGPEELKIKELLSRLSLNLGYEEIILATNPSIEGETTSIYLMKLLQPLGIRLTKLAYGIPVGGLLEYTDRQTISKALENRMEIT